MTDSNRSNKWIILIYAVLMLLIVCEIVLSCNSQITSFLHIIEWWRESVILLFVLLVFFSFVIAKTGSENDLRSLHPASFFWLGWILCFGGIIATSFLNTVQYYYMMWVYFSLSVIPAIWIIWTKYRSGQKALSNIVAKSMIVGSFLFTASTYALIPLLEHEVLPPDHEFYGILVHPNSNGILCSGFAIAAVYLLLTNLRYSYLYAFSFGLSASIIIASNCRSAELGLVLAIAAGAVYYLRHRGRPSRQAVKKMVLCILLIAAVCAASFCLLRDIDQTDPDGTTENAARPMTAEQTDTFALGYSEEESLYERINKLSSDRLTIWNAFIPEIKPLGNGETEGPITDANDASYSAHNNVIEVFYISGYAAGAGIMLWMLYCLYFIGRALFMKSVFRPQELFFVMSFIVFFIESMLDVMQYPFARSITLMVYLSMGTVAFRRRNTGAGYHIIKRLLDIVIGAIGCILLLPVMGVVRIVQCATGDKGPLFFTQIRVGRKGRLFKIYKFRTMVPEAEEILDDLLEDEFYIQQWEEKQKIEDDPRITKTGRLLRRMAIDEMPQVINVLKGEMSIVGPRPLVPDELEEHDGLPLYQKVRPGMTGWWICHGHNDMDYNDRLKKEYHYVLNCSLWMDAVCVVMTMLQLIVKR